MTNILGSLFQDSYPDFKFKKFLIFFYKNILKNPEYFIYLKKYKIQKQTELVLRVLCHCRKFLSQK